MIKQNLDEIYQQDKLPNFIGDQLKVQVLRNLSTQNSFSYENFRLNLLVFEGEVKTLAPHYCKKTVS